MQATSTRLINSRGFTVGEKKKKFAFCAFVSSLERNLRRNGFQFFFPVERVQSFELPLFSNREFEKKVYHDIARSLSVCNFPERD